MKKPIKSISRSLMLNEKTFLVIIPARGGSKRLPRKNVLPLARKPLIAWSIEASLKSKYVDKVIVSSDDNEILEISKNYGSSVIRRPDKLASDTASSFDAIVHTIEAEKRYDYVILIQPTSPLRTVKHIDESIELLIKKKADAIISVTPTEHSPLWSNVLPQNNSMKTFLNDNILNTRSQDLDTYYRLNGAIYICNTEKLLKNKSFFLKENIYAYIMDNESSVDIDEKIDFKLAELLKMEK